ncbi:hypothetical protein PtrSN002B_009576 [Pyrenophora tritici-repentis]|uniref:RING Zn-finger protein n=2 Tax=Pyrenophora tritici-repentis TaxID=45151 RepID=A0A2W1E596_9PLEO|nr:uncharacterized protein PTRG_11527 [Pyrenophora tritici-repentis Pt-1C-BFP]KAA8624553.1 RING Zn-finger containing protein [Pyrenophora tritici-repentis]EDU44577.1 predicted protein [Pyrenophora tritici-repentis Pt-1C-BFP]KAF7452954.1 hypothetical protein A1F99_002120 [Pyrenophora tritici-repentis]KAF7575999.1 RING Zn-finger protein [Pyrenophora tritici-repentis]KAG9377595.1 hypothetical protein A1F94_011998 [Pyrenophora tritici-repentis]
MPAIISEHGTTAVLLGAREWRDTVGGSGMTPTAFSFLIPVFVVAIAAPFLCVFCIRRRRQATPIPARPPPKIKKPALRRAEAREKLLEVTEVSSRSSNDVGEEGGKVNVETKSVLERECAICLSTLHAPAPPEPAKLSPDTPITDAAALPASIPASDDAATATATPDAEIILKLSICGHEFHADCLVSWFVLRKTSCPICRSVYMSKEELDQHDEEEQLALNAGLPPAMLEEGRAGQPQGPSTRNWHYFLRGRNAARREAVQAPEQPAVEMQSQTPRTAEGEHVPVEAANGTAVAQAETPARSRLQRLLRRG